jgi:tetratricopeptide (TPR) repeat protein
MKLQKFLFLIIGIVFIALTNLACVDQETSLASGSPDIPAENMMTEDIDVHAAQKVIEKTPNSAEGYNKLAIVYIRKARETGDFSLNTNAQTAVNRALEIEPQNLQAQKLKGSLLLTFHRFEEALNFAQQLQKQYPQDPSIYGALTDANVELGNYKEALDAVQTMVDLRPTMESYARVSYVRSLYGDSAGAIEAMGIAARIVDPREKEAQAWCLVHLGDEHFKIGQFAEAEKQYDLALQVFPNYHFALAGKGHTRAAVGDFENAVNLFTQAQNKIPLTETVIALGDIYTKSGKTEEAKKQYDLAEFIEQKLGDASDQRRLALLWADHDVKLDAALDIATREHAKRKDIFTADILAWNLYKKGDFQAAKKIINEAMRLKTKDARIFYHAGMIEKGLGNKKGAAEFLQKALQTNPSFDILQADKARQALQELK